MMEVKEITLKYPSGLKTAEECAESLKYGITAERLTELAESRLVPHVRIDNGPPLFRVTPVKQWIMENCFKEEQGAPMQIHVVVAMEKATERPPKPLQDIGNLCQMPPFGYEPAIYFLCEDGEVVYVGQSVSPQARIASHINTKKFDQVFCLPTARSDLNVIEAKFITLLEPALNGRSKNGKLLMPVTSEEEARRAHAELVAWREAHQ